MTNASVAIPEEPEESHRLLIVDDDDDYRRVLGHYVTLLGYECDLVASGEEAMANLTEKNYSLVLTDMMMPRIDGMQLLCYVKENYPAIDVLVLTGFSKNFTFSDVITAGATDYMEKPVSRDELKAKLHRVFRERETLRFLRQEIAKRQATEIRLKGALRAAALAGQAKKEFLNNVNHELRTPMSAIMGFSELSLRNARPEKLPTYLQLIRSAAERMLLVIDGLLDFSKIDSGQFKLRPSAFKLRAQVEPILRRFRQQAAEKSLQLRWKFADNVPEELHGDHLLLSKVIHHLVGNAIKFTCHGEVAIQVEVESATTETAFIHFAILDTGIGVAARKREEIFAAFCQADGSPTRKFEGLGVGLALAAKIVLLMGGKLWQENRPAPEPNVRLAAPDQGGPGSIFHFTVPLHYRHPPFLSPPVALRSSDSPLSILLAEDDGCNRQLMVDLLEAKGWQVTPVVNGKELLALLTTKEFNLLLVDVMMPEVSGLEATTRIRAQEKTRGGYLPIIAFTGLAQPDDRDKCLAIGMDGYLAKPSPLAEIYATIEEQAKKYRPRDARTDDELPR